MNLKNHWEHILKSLPDGITITDTRGVVIFVSDTLIRTIGADSDKELLGTNIKDWIHPEDRDKANFYIKNASEEISTSGAAEYRMIKLDKTYLYLESKGKVFKDKDNNILGMIYCSRDITERKKLEENQLYVSKHESIELLAGSIAHDFNNILTVIMGQISLLKMDLPAKNESRVNILETEKAIKQAKLITNQLLTLSADGFPDFSVFPIDELLEETVGLIFMGTDIKYNINCSNENISINADRVQISRVLDNLLINAIESMPDGGNIDIEILKTKGFKHKFLVDKTEYLCLSISDNGIGISKKDMPRIFDPFFTTKTRGTGLGLFSAFSIIKNHKGHLIASSNTTKGSSFKIYLPLE